MSQEPRNKINHAKLTAMFEAKGWQIINTRRGIAQSFCGGGRMITHRFGKLVALDYLEGVRTIPEAQTFGDVSSWADQNSSTDEGLGAAV